MSKVQPDNTLQAIISHAKEYGFVFPSSEIYDGLSAVYDYGPYGAQLKKNIRDYWWNSMTQLNENIVGIDIEKNREKIKIIQHKFVNFESGFIHKDDDYIQQLTVIWGAKESLYKIYPHGGLTFKNDIDINSFQIADKKTTGYIKVEGWDKNYSIEFHQIDGFTLVYAIDTANND